jgi:hypothetical protein
MASSILLPKNVDLSKITFGTPKLLNGGARIVPISYEGKTLIFQTARLVCSYGLSKWGEGATAKYSIDGSFKGRDESPSVKHFFDFLMNFDKFMVEKGVENSVEWLKKKHSSSDVVAALYTHAVRFAKDKETGEVTDKYPPAFKMTIPFKDGKSVCNVYDDKQNAIDILETNSSSIKGSTVTSIIKCTGIWIAGGNYGLTFRVEQLRMEPTANHLAGFAFQDEDDDTLCDDNDDDEMDGIDAPTVPQVTIPVPDEVAIEEEHDVEVEVPEVETTEEPKPKAAPKAKAAKKV